MRGEKNHIDEWLQKQIKNGITIIDKVLNNNINEWELYYTGHLQRDILTNFPGRTSKKIFKGYKELLKDRTLIFTQKRFDKESYDYYVQKINAQ